MSIFLTDEQILKTMFHAVNHRYKNRSEIQQIDRFHIVTEAQAVHAVHLLLRPCPHGVNRLCDCPDCVKSIYEELGKADLMLIL